MMSPIPAVLACLIALAAPAAAQTDGRDKAVKWNTVDNKSAFAWLQHLNVSESEVEAKAVDKAAARSAVADLKRVSRAVLSNAEEIIDKIETEAVAAADVVRGDDLLLVKHQYSDGQLTVHDGRDLVLLLKPTTGPGSLEPEQLQKHVMEQAAAVLRLPPAEAEKLTFFISQADLGNSKAGWIYYGKKDSSPDWLWKHWYSAIGWWSDGTRVMFAIDKYPILHPDKSIATMKSAPPEAKGPRNFSKK